MSDAVRRCGGSMSDAFCTTITRGTSSHLEECPDLHPEQESVCCEAVDDDLHALLCKLRLESLDCEGMG